MQRISKFFMVFSLLISSLCQAKATERPLTDMRKDFLLAEQYLNENREPDYFNLENALKNYPLYPYLHYQWLKKHLDDDSSISQFLADFPQSRYAHLLLQKWLQQLGQTQQWLKFMAAYKNTDDPELQCYNAQAQFQTGRPDTALDSARQFWLSGKSLPNACDNLFTILKGSSYLNRDLIWGRFQAALLQNNPTVAINVMPLLPAEDQPAAELWLKLHRQPNLVKEPGDWKLSLPQAGQLFAHTIMRWLKSDPTAALQTWEAEKSHFTLTDALFADTEKQLALALAFKHDEQAYQRLSQLTAKDSSTREWRVRTALYQQNWPQVQDALNALSGEEKIQDKWQYWQARALLNNGDAEKANSIFQQLAKNRSFYGFLAADRLQQTINLADHPVNVSTEEISNLQQQDRFQVVAELLAINRKPEAQKQWWFAVTGMDKHNLTIAAKLAQQWQLPAIAIFSIAKANDWDDIDLRFPLYYAERIQNSAAEQQLDPALIFGLIRQESAFDELADSSAGAKGLMQVMPKTAEQIAQDLQQPWSGETSLFNPDLNIKYGSYYYKKLLNQFNGYPLLATAAYNAGANRVKRWLPERNTLPGDIWMETIPYKETRGYVASVLQYALIYQQRLQKQGLKPSLLLPEIKPGKPQGVSNGLKKAES